MCVWVCGCAFKIQVTFNMELPLKIGNIGTMLLVMSESASASCEAKSVEQIRLKH